MEEDDERITAVREENLELLETLGETISLEDPALFYLCIENTYGLPLERIQNRIEICKLLLSKNPNLLNHNGIIADWDGNLYEGPLLANYIHPKILIFLIRESANIQQVYAKETVVHTAAWYMNAMDFHFFCLFLIKECKAEFLFAIDKTKWKNPLVHILRYGKEVSVKTVDVLLKLPGVLELKTFDQRHVLLRASFYGGKSKDIRKRLVEAGARILVLKSQEKLQSPLLNAAHTGNYPLIKSIVSRGADITVSTVFLRNFLHISAWVLPEPQYRQIVERTLEHKDWEIVLNAKNIEGRTPLHDRLRTYKITSAEFVDFVLEKTKEETNNIDAWGNNMFLSAVRGGKSRPVLEVLVKHGANTSLLNFGDQNAFHLAACAGNFEAVLYMLELKVIDVHKKCSHEATALTYAKLALKKFVLDPSLQYRIPSAKKVVQLLELEGVEDVERPGLRFDLDWEDFFRI